jgi:hypothetical protein
VPALDGVSPDSVVALLKAQALLFERALGPVLIELKLMNELLARLR